MKSLCGLFNRYRDGMLDSEHSLQFESHLAACDHCRPRLFSLNQMVHAMKAQDIPQPVIPAETVAARTYQQSGSWDLFLLSWLKPLPAWSSLGVLLVLVTFLWIASLAQQPLPTDYYESVITSGNQAGSTVVDLSDERLETWLEEGGTLQ